MSENTTIAVIGGTGAEGSGLALRWAHAGHRVIIGSRDAAKAQAGAEELRGRQGGGSIEGLKDVLAGKILVDVTVPLVPPKVSRVQLPESDSCVVAIQDLLGPEVR